MSAAHRAFIASAAHRAFIGLGSNLDDPVSQVRRALRALERLGSVRASSLYRSEPLVEVQADAEPQPWYVNAVAELRTDAAPHALLEALQQIERAAGRPPDHVRWSARVLDLDLLLYDERTLESATLCIPHAELHRRRFVLQPLVELAPAVCHPRTGLTAAQLLRELSDPLRVERIAPERARTESLTAVRIP